MFALAIELLAGRYVATAYNDRDRVEWPPHPARLFSALVATWADGDPQSGEGEVELQALQWLERQSAPDILASSRTLAGMRDVVPVFVPVNDVGVVSAPDRGKLDAAEAALGSATEPKELLKAEKGIKKLQDKLIDDTAKAVAAPDRFNKADGNAAAKLFAERRPKQPRTFPSATPDCAAVGFVWPGAEVPESLRPALERLLRRLVRLGHSSTLVHGAMHDAATVEVLAARTTRYVPDEVSGDLVIRWVGEGQTTRLMRALEQHRETEPRVLPARFFRYREGAAALSRSISQSVFQDELVVFARVGGPRLPITATAGVARQFRRALMSCADEPIHEMLSGHKQGGAVSDTPHLAVVPLPVVSGPHPDGALIGLGLALPRASDGQARAAVMRAIANLEGASTGSSAEAPVVFLKLGDAGVLELQRVVWGEDHRATLQSGSWTRASRLWASATPVALDRNPGDLHDPDVHRRQAAFAEAAGGIIEAVRHIGLPAPVSVDVLRSCVLPGTAKPITYPRFPAERQRPQRVMVHVRLTFAEPVKGPVLLGAGRYHGLGLFVPLDLQRDRGGRVFI